MDLICNLQGYYLKSMLKKVFAVLYLCFTMLLPFHAVSQQTADELFDEGTLLFSDGQYNEAVSKFRSAAKVYESETNLSRSAESYNRLADSWLYSGSVDSANFYFRQALTRAKKSNASSEENYAISAIGEILYLKGEYKKSLNYNKQYLRNVKGVNEQEYSSWHRKVGQIYTSLSMYDSAEWYLLESVRIKNEIGDLEKIPLSYNALGILYRSKNDPATSVDYHLKALEGFASIGDSGSMVLEYKNVADQLILQNNYSLAKEYAEKSLSIAEKLGYRARKAAVLNTLALIAANENDDTEALRLYQEALEIFEYYKAWPKVLYQLRGIANIHLNNEAYEEAGEPVERGLALARKMDKPLEILEFSILSARVSAGMDQLKKAETILESSLTLSTRIKDHRKTFAAYTLLSEIYEREGDLKRALLNSRKAELLRDSIFNLDQAAVAQELEAKYARSQKDKEIALLNTQNEVMDLRVQKSNRQRLVAVLGLLLAIAVAGGAVYLVRLNQKNSKRLEEKNRVIEKALGEKEVLLKEIHHRVKNNLQVVSSLLNLQSRHIEDEAAQSAIKEGRNRVRSMALIHQNLYQEDNLTGIDIAEYIENLCKSLFGSYNIKEERVKLETDINDLNLDVDTVIPIGLILNELITNALKYAFPDDREGVVGVSLKQDQDILVLEVKDNGIGIPDTNNVVKSGSFGYRLINSFTQKLQAELELENLNGTLVRLNIRKFKNAKLV